jgi:hypothetical protein
MTTKLVTRPFKTGEVTIMSNITSITATGHQISILEARPERAKGNGSTVHLTFEVEHPQKLSSILGSDRELGLMMERKDAIEIGLLLVAMGMEDKSHHEVVAVLDRLSKLIADLGEH